MKKYIGILLFSFLLVNCSKIDDALEKLPPYQADLYGAITNASSVELALIGVYSNLPSVGFYSVFVLSAGSFKAGTMTRPSWWKRGNAVYYLQQLWLL